MASGNKQPLDAERLLRLQQYERQFDQQRMGDPNFAWSPRWAPHRPWRATFGDYLLALLGALTLIAAVVAYVFF